ncbi:hypothetical protein GUY44_07220 [Pimelobacter simplex]|uniref:Phage protein n=1 Tax=Nocardioides simplex TaxID=2045 RepID=A0A0A1DMK7_NOCSI|nr:hypothetical protein [Pimelobacter simplex]AIY17793.1 Phage protein [Pimelobacter simplex]MCG8150263.1 hypothetical protein [Pimelobacter simplex]GEB13528.1 hypothetical protein NSI01_18430 [Pimelobacter simplex]SFM72239.1 hypothetical protein SAMN05421671_3144 [Pimelobacter simplex]
MTAGFIAATVNGWLDSIRTGGANVTAVTTAYVKLHTGDPGAAGSANAAAGSTTRVAVSHTAPAGGAMTMSGTAPAWTNGGTSETITHISVWDSLTAGSCKYTGQLSASKAWGAGDTLTLTSLGVSITPVAS